MRRSKRLLVAGLAMAMVASACGTDSSGSGEGLQIVATTSILGDVAQNIVGDAAEVEVLMPIGADPHDFAASSQQVAAINEADLVVANGFGLEEGLESVLEAAESDGVRVLHAAEFVAPLPEDHEDEGEDHEDDAGDHEGEDHEDDAGEHDHGGVDPHFWLDPVRMSQAVEAIGAELAAIDPDSDHDWVASADSYTAELLEANEGIETVLSAVAEGDRKLVTSHRSFDYFADRYEFDIIGVIIPGGSTTAQPSSEELAELVHVIEDEDVPAVFGETIQSTDLAETISTEVGRDVEVVELYTGSLGEPGSDAGTYIGMLETNAGLIADALG